MRKEYYNYAVKMPAVLHEMFREKVSDYHFSNMAAVMNHLIKSYIAICDRKKVSRATSLVLSRMKRLPDMAFFFRHQEKSIFIFEMEHTLAGELERVITISGTANRTQFAISIICSFVSSADTTLQKLAGEVIAGSAFQEPDTYLIRTYVSDYQHVFLKETASIQRISVEGMLTAAAELLVRTTDKEAGYYTPNALQEIIDHVLAINGSTLKDFRRQGIVSIRTNTIGNDRIRFFMQKYKITSPREFLRRVVLFFLEARYLIYKKEIEIQEEDLPEDSIPDWEESMYSSYTRNDFARSIYM